MLLSTKTKQTNGVNRVHSFTKEATFTQSTTTQWQYRFRGLQVSRRTQMAPPFWVCPIWRERIPTSLPLRRQERWPTKATRRLRAMKEQPQIRTTNLSSSIPSGREIQTCSQCRTKHRNTKVSTTMRAKTATITNLSSRHWVRTRYWFPIRLDMRNLREKSHTKTLSERRRMTPITWYNKGNRQSQNQRNESMPLSQEQRK